MRRFQISGKPRTGLAFRIVRGFASCFAGTGHQQPRATTTETARSISLRSLRRHRLLAQLPINIPRCRPFAELAAATVSASFLSSAYSCHYHCSAGSRITAIARGTRSHNPQQTSPLIGCHRNATTPPLHLECQQSCHTKLHPSCPATPVQHDFMSISFTLRSPSFGQVCLLSVTRWYIKSHCTHTGEGRLHGVAGYRQLSRLLSSHHR